MRRNRNIASTTLAGWAGILTMAAVSTMLLALAPAGLAQTDESKPEELGKQRSTLYVQATRAPLADLEEAVNQLAVLSETCRAEHGAKACGLPDKALASDKLEERYAYYVKGPVEAHSKGRGVKIDRRNWVGSDVPAQP